MKFYNNIISTENNILHHSSSLRWIYLCFVPPHKAINYMHTYICEYQEHACYTDNLKQEVIRIVKCKITVEC